MVFLSLQEEVEYILKDCIYDCDGINKECNKCICNVGEWEDNM